MKTTIEGLSMNINQEVVRNTRARTSEAWKSVGKTGSVPTPVCDLFSALIQRIEDLEELLGYAPSNAAKVFESLDKMDTQGR